ncbi:hypothetical protein [Paenibacillus uliginis]|nr:hypothetical protein [Paenibacillus uliginis]
MENFKIAHLSTVDKQDTTSASEYFPPPANQEINTSSSGAGMKYN